MLEMLEIVVMIAVVAVAVTEIIVPILRGMILFPHLRSRQAKLEREIAHLRQGEAERGLEAEVRQKKLQAWKEEGS